MSSKGTASDADEARADHAVVEAGHRYKNNDNPVTLRWTGSSFAQTHPGGVCNLLDLNAGISPKIYVHPEINAVTYVYE